MQWNLSITDTLGQHELSFINYRRIISMMLEQQALSLIERGFSVPSGNLEIASRQIEF